MSIKWIQNPFCQYNWTDEGWTCGFGTCVKTTEHFTQTTKEFDQSGKQKRQQKDDFDEFSIGGFFLFLKNFKFFKAF